MVASPRSGDTGAPRPVKLYEQSGVTGAYGDSPKIVCRTVNRVIYHHGKKALVGSRACRSAGSYRVVPGSYYLIRDLDF